ncbi:MAG: hypothetical protein H5T69_20905 [Chloroflexi bacterium]|nr:hypothetical protein [Chloroflexota bacterium]
MPAVYKLRRNPKPGFHKWGMVQMGVVILVSVVLLGCFLFFRMARKISLRILLVSYYAIALTGLAVGYITTQWEYQPFAKLRVIGFPFPVGAWSLEQGEWICYSAPLGMVILVMVANMVLFALAFGFVFFLGIVIGSGCLLKRPSPRAR